MTEPAACIDALAVEYFPMPGAPGRYFRCARYGVMSASVCGQNYRAAPTESKVGRLHGCIACNIGARHAGVVVVVLPARWAPTRKVCTRCRRQSSAYGKQANGPIRMVRQSTLCVSCFNREREAIKGFNAKGSKPIKTHKPWPVCVAVRADGKVFAVYLRAVQSLSFEVEGVIDRLWCGSTIDEITFAVPVEWWEGLERKAERPEHAMLHMFVEEKPGAVWPPMGIAEPFEPPQWVRKAGAAGAPTGAIC